MTPMHTATLLLVVLAAGLISQWVAWRIRLPAIVVLITAGILLGPATGVIEIGMAQSELTEMIGFGVAIILFEGGMDLKLGEFKRVGHGVGRLTLVAPPIAWLLGSLAAHYLGGLSWPVSMVLGAILVVTGPTVILPLLRQAKLNKESASLLKWEGIVNDPVGVLLAVLTFQYLTIGGGISKTLLGVAAAIAAAAVFGGLGGWLIGKLYQRGGVPEHLKPPLLMVMVLIVYWASNLVQHEAGLLSVTLMGMVIGNMHLVERESLQRFKENLTVVLLSVLFIIIPSQLQASQLDLLDWRTLAFVFAVLLLVRPLTIALATIGAPMRGGDKILLGWVAPRGIVAAATAGIFGPALVAAGYPDAERLLPITFAVIIATVLAHGLTMGRLGRHLGLAARSDNGVLFVGSSPWTVAFARVLKRLDIDVLIVDGVYSRLKEARMDNLPVYYGEILSDHAEHTLEAQHLNHLLCGTVNDFYNALVCKAQGRRYGNHRSFQFATHKSSGQQLNQLTLQQRGYFAFSEDATYEFLHERLNEGWLVQTTKLTKSYGWSEFSSRGGEQGKDWLLLGGVSPTGMIRLYSPEQKFKLEAGWTAIYFGPESTGREAKPAEASEAG
ncbi:cation:proton antiporter [Piscinibacter sakaiensis]|uniref:cation:proton antiporter n=1 Tax=Piscinibacter sakaiensis TaxID=1547922 RepID=UPI003AB102C0